MVHQLALRTLVVPAVALLVACAGEPEPVRTVHDLAASLPAADVAWEPGRVDLGTPAARSALVPGGWGRNERQGDRRWVWSLGDGAAFDLFVAARRDLVLELTLQPFAAPGLPAQRIGLAVGTPGGTSAQPLGELELRSGTHTYDVAVPAAALRPGLNRFRVEHAWSRAPAAVSDSDDHRPLAVAWHRLRVLEAGAGTGAGDAAGDDDAPRPPPRVVGDGDLHLPAGSRVDFHLALPPGARLVADRLRARDGATLTAGLLRRGTDAEEELLRGRGAEDGLEVDLDGGAVDLARLSLRVPPGDGGVVLENPRIVVAARPEHGAPADSGETAGTGTPTGSGAARRSGPTARPATPDRPAPRPDLVLYVIDTLRADHLGAYGHPRDATPRLDAFAAEAVLFERARAQSPWTQPSVASLFTGLWPADHGVVSGETRLPEELPSLPALLRGAGYRTAAVVANGYVSESFGFARGFDHFRMLPDLHTRAGAVQAAALDWLDARPEGDDRPFFLYLHTIDPHAPYDPPPETAARFAPGVDPELGGVEPMAELSSGRHRPAGAAKAALAADLDALYTGDVAWQDREIGRFFDALAERGLYEGAVLLVVADHGEELGEHGRWTHGLDLYGETLDVPLLLRLPGGAAGGTRVAETVSHVDVLPTLLALAGVEEGRAAAAPGAASAGRSLLPAAAGDRATDAGPRPPDLAGRPVFSHLDRYRTTGACVELGRWKLILPASPALGDAPELYDRAADPGERHDVAARHPVLAGWLAGLVRGELARARRGGPPAPAAEMDDETRRRLRALGYLH